MGILLFLRRYWRFGPFFIAGSHGDRVIATASDRRRGGTGTRPVMRAVAPPVTQSAALVSTAAAPTAPAVAAGFASEAQAGAPHELAYRFWPPLQAPAIARAIVLFDSESRESEPGAELLAALRADGFAVVWWSGGRTPGTTPPGPARPGPTPSGTPPTAAAPTLSAAAQALDRLTRLLQEDLHIALPQLAIVAQGAAASAALTWAHDYAPRVRGLVAASDGQLWPCGAARAEQTMVDDGECLTRVVKDAEAIDVPMLALVSAAPDDPLRPVADAILRTRAARTATQAIVSGPPPTLQAPLTPATQHRQRTPDARDVTSASDRGESSHVSKPQTPENALRAFLQDIYGASADRPSLLAAHEHGFTKAELDRFLQPLPRFSRRGLRIAFAKASIQTTGLLSDGMRIGLRTGFDSGSSMEYVYTNVPSGVTAIGRKLDAAYLRSPGWMAIRVRRRNVQRLIAETARRTQDEGRALHVIDIAAGLGRYVTDALLELRRRPDSLLLQEFVAENVERGGLLLQACGLRDIGAFVHGDAFDEVALAARRPRPTLSIACGIYELFPDNARVVASLRGLSQAMEPGGYLLYTNQPYQPLLEFFVRVVPSHRGDQPCVVRRRTQAEIDQLVESAGFTKLSQVIDARGIFSVSIARKTGPPAGAPVGERDAASMRSPASPSPASPPIAGAGVL